MLEAWNETPGLKSFLYEEAKNLSKRYLNHREMYELQNKKI